MNSLAFDSPEMTKICSAAKASNIATVLGFSENDNNSLYISQCIISSSGGIVMKRRKLKPTHMERTVFGDAGGSSLNNVVDVEGVGKVGALACWEHTQPLLKYHTISLREQIHVAAWPPIHHFEEGSAGLFSMSAEGKLDVFTGLSDTTTNDYQAAQRSLKHTP
jgi:nitrilase